MRKTRQRSRPVLRSGILAIALGLILGMAGRSEAQWWGPYYGGVNGGMGFYGLPAFGLPVGFGGGGYYGAYGYPGWGTGYGYGAGYGFGGYGGYGGWGWGVGMSLADQWMLKYQRYALNAARYNLMNAQTATSYQAALLLRQQALQTMLENYTGNKYYDSGNRPVAGGSSNSTMPANGGNPRRVQGDIPFNKLVARDGEVLWPLGAPTDGDLAAKKEAADQAIAEVVRDYANDRNVSVHDAVAARRALGDYAYPAAQEMKERGGEDYDDWVSWVSSLDRGLRALAGTAGGRGRATASPAQGLNIEIKPETAPESAGEVLKKQIQKESKPPSSSESPGRTPPTTENGDNAKP